MYNSLWYVYRSVDAHKKQSEKAVYIMLSSYLFESLLYLRKLIRSPDSQHKISRRSGSAAGKCWGRFSQSSEKHCLQLSQGQPYSFYPAKIGACRISLQRPSTSFNQFWAPQNELRSCFLLHCIELTKKNPDVRPQNVCLSQFLARALYRQWSNQAPKELRLRGDIHHARLWCWNDVCSMMTSN